MQKRQQDQSQIKWVADFIWNIADDRLRDVYVRGKYRDVILPFTVLRRIDAVLEPTKQAVLERKRLLDSAKVANQDGALQAAAGQAFYNVSEFTLAKLKASAAGQRLREDFIAYLDGFSPNVQEILQVQFPQSDSEACGCPYPWLPDRRFPRSRGESLAVASQGCRRAHQAARAR